MASEFFWREFTRDGEFDKDHVADQSFRDANFKDFFGKWLQQGENAYRQSFHSLLMHFLNEDTGPDPLYCIKTFMVADGSFFDLSKNPGAEKWFNPHLRLVTLITLADKDPFSPSTSEWTLCIVGGRNPLLWSRAKSFLQVASWDGLTFRFYQSDFPNDDRRNQSWTYFGESMEAFGPSEYLGPFNGHVNGACIMKELHTPWLHWFGGAPVNFKACIPAEIKEKYKDLPYITNKGQGVFSAVNQNPEELETAIKNGIVNWFLTRRKKDFFDSSSKLLKNPTNIPRWVSHLFLTTTINMQAAYLKPLNKPSLVPDAIIANVPKPKGVWVIPENHFYDQELLCLPNFSTLLPPQKLNLSFSDEIYHQAADSLGLNLLQEVGEKDDHDMHLPWQSLGGDKRTDEGVKKENVYFRKVLLSEGETPFNMLHASFEDAHGVQRMQTLKKIPPSNDPKAIAPVAFIGLFSANTFNAIMMVDFWNPIYSWRRGRLMQYVPQNTTFDGNSYDLDARFVDNVKNSQWAKIDGTPEQQFVQLLGATLQDHQKAISDYFAAIQARMKADPKKALYEYMLLAESRRRIYRPLPLDEFGYTMPYATNVPFTTPFLEMTPAGEVVPMPERGQKFLKEWTDALGGVDPRVLPASDADPSQAPLTLQALPRPSRLALRCQNIANKGRTLDKKSGAQGCPYLASRKTANSVAATATNDALYTPTWEDDILPLVQSPHWVSDPAAKGAEWIRAMKKWGANHWNLGCYEDVKQRAVSIYRHLRSESMPITKDPQDYWPESALEVFRNWANGGFPRNKSETPVPKMVIPKPVEPRTTYKTRQDIMTLTRSQLAEYQSKLDDVLKVGVLGSKWQELGLLHAEWCLHYQEATFLWHRAFLRYVEKLIDFPIPYWNGYSVASKDSKSSHAGIPPYFFEETYIHPKDGSIRPNPLKYALSLDGKSADGTSQYVVRDKILAEGPSSDKWKKKICMMNLYHSQITNALQQSTFTSSETEEHFGIPWANIQSFSQKQPDKWYPHRFDFDGLFEQVHDNFHGWTGPDMADNTYTAFDPIFLSYHANMDRLAGIFIESHPENHFTSNFPLQPFIDNGTNLSYDDPRRWIYTTIGDMAKDTRALGYVYGVPASPDVYTPPSLLERGVRNPRPSGGRAVHIPKGVNINGNSDAETSETNGIKAANAESVTKIPFVVFTDVGCTSSSYRIDVFAPNAQSLIPDILDNPDFIGQITRIGMGPGKAGVGLKNSSRCRKPAASRMLNAEHFVGQLAADEAVKMVVTDLQDGRELTEEEYLKLPGFQPKVLWLPKA
ncbi:hypothetical protein V8C42DRAFT_316712 [Trichoderma barbatum]